LIRAGRFRKRIDIVEVKTTRSSSGALVPSESVFACAWAAIEPLNGRELFDAARESVSISTRVRMRPIEGVTEAMHVDFEGRKYDIETVINHNERDREMILMCSERKEGLPVG
jgi:SPP1 family predicted phage head-tail adaptor